MQSLLQIVQAHCRRTGLPVPGAIIGTQNAGFTQLQALLEEVGEELASRFTWSELRRFGSFTTVAAKLQGALTTLAGSSFERIIPNTMWNSTEEEEIVGPGKFSDYQSDETFSREPLVTTYYQIGGNLYISPAPTAGQTVTFGWQSKAWIVSADGTTYRTSFVDDGDLVIFDDALIKLGLRYKWKQEKGLPYAEEMRSFEAMAMDKAARTGTQGALSMAGGPKTADPRYSVGLSGQIGTVDGGGP